MTSTAPDLDLDERTAVVVVDVQNDFADPDGGLYVSGGEDTVGVINDLIADARDAGALVAYTQDWHPPRTPHFQADGGTWPVHCVAGTWGAELHPALEVDGPIVRKGTGEGDGYSGFATRDLDTGEDRDTGLQDLLEERGVRHVVVVGLAQDVCVKETALDARRHGFDTTVFLNATRAVEVEPGDADAANAALAAAGVRLV
jgi:nicotinamidase/pyrazinamidase